MANDKHDRPDLRHDVPLAALADTAGSGGLVNGVDETLATRSGGLAPSRASAALDETLAPAGIGAEPVIVRAGQRDDYEGLVPVDPQHYVIGRELARGGMGRITAARDRRLGRHVAVKELLVGTSDLKARFEREARITARLQHPAIVNLLEAGVWPGGEPFYVMKLVAGDSLDKVVAARPTIAARLALLPNVIAAPHVGGLTPPA